MIIIETLQQEHNEVAAKLAELDERVKNERPALVAQLSQLGRAIKALSGTQTPRKPMSPEGKERIRQGLEKARAAKLAAATPPVATPVSDNATGAKKSPASDKGPNRVH